MTRLLSIVLIGLAAFSCKPAERVLGSKERTDKAYALAESITAERIRPILTALAHDSMKGRNTGSPEEWKAADYLAAWYTRIGATPAGVDGTWFQPFELARANRRWSLQAPTSAPAGADLLKSRNVVAVVEGSDPALRDQYVVVMAHYDHVGIGRADARGDSLHNGADDNASGTTGLMILAETLQQARAAGYGPRRSVLFLHVSAEERGLLGSRYFSDNPTRSIDSTIAAINLDMVGRIDQAHRDRADTNYIYLIGSELVSSHLDSLLRSANNRTGRLSLDPALNDINDPQQIYRRSDHWNFGRLGVPFAFFFSGLHEDYHRPGDESHKIAYEAMALRLRTAYGTVIELANTDKRPTIDNQLFIERAQQGR